MSSDNYYYIDKHPLGGFAVEMGFASDDLVPDVTEKSLRFDTLKEAEVYVADEYSEYGFTYSQELGMELGL